MYFLRSSYYALDMAKLLAVVRSHLDTGSLLLTSAAITIYAFTFTFPIFVGYHDTLPVKHKHRNVTERATEKPQN